MPKFFMGGIVFLLLLGTGYGISQAARAIPWDCSDWQAFAHDDRPTAILESLAENRGKTLYCGIDQSDTFAKAETWEAGKDRNERDDTVYFGERGQFRGFLASQEGWLTEGESGITGVSIDRIFEFPREERKRPRREPRPNLVYGREYPDSALSVPQLTANPHRNDNTQPDGPTTGYVVRDYSDGRDYDYVRAPRSLWNGYVRVYGANGASAATVTAAQAEAKTEWDTQHSDRCRDNEPGAERQWRDSCYQTGNVRGAGRGHGGVPSSG